MINKVEDEYRIRKITPVEAWRLMGFSTEDCNAAKAVGVSNSQLYKQAGNSIVVDVLYYIYRNLYNAMPYLFEDLKLSSFFSGIGAFEKALDRLYVDINNDDLGGQNECLVSPSGVNNAHKKPIMIGSVYDNPNGYTYGRATIYDTSGIMATVTTNQGGGCKPHVVVKSTNPERDNDEQKQ